jgi:hypothetical protein
VVAAGGPVGCGQVAWWARLTCHLGILRLTGRLGTVAAVLLALDGLGQIIAGIFTLDPSNGFPEGAPSGLPETVSTHGNLRGLDFMLSMTSWVLLLLVLARRHARAHERAWSLASLACAIALLATAACLMTDFGTVLLYVVLSATWLFTGATMQHLRRTPVRSGDQRLAVSASRWQWALRVSAPRSTSLGCLPLQAAGLNVSNPAAGALISSLPVGTVWSGCAPIVTTRARRQDRPSVAHTHHRHTQRQSVGCSCRDPPWVAHASFRL